MVDPSKAIRLGVGFMCTNYFNSPPLNWGVSPNQGLVLLANSSMCIWAPQDLGVLFLLIIPPDCFGQIISTIKGAEIREQMMSRFVVPLSLVVVS